MVDLKGDKNEVIGLLGLSGDLQSTALSQTQASEPVAAASGGPEDEDEATLLEVIENQNKLK